MLMRRLIRGPWLWANAGVFKHLKQSLQFPAECGDLRTIARASQFRVACNEYRSEGGLLLDDRVARVEKLERYSRNTRLYQVWGEWLKGGYSRQLHTNYNNLKTKPWEVSQSGVENRISKGDPRPWTEKVARKVIKGTQAMCLKLIRPKPHDTHAKLGKELDKWHLGSYSRTHTDRAFRVLGVLKQRVPPKVIAAHYRAWMDGWTTSARMHSAGGTRPCIWCGLREGDKLQHYCGCPALQRWRSKRLAIPWASDTGERHTQFFNLSSPNKKDPLDTVIRGLALASCYHAYNACTHSQSPPSQEEAIHALNQSLKEMVKGRCRLVKLVDAVWAIKRSRTRFSFKAKPDNPSLHTPDSKHLSVFIRPVSTAIRPKGNSRNPGKKLTHRNPSKRKTKPQGGLSAPGRQTTVNNKSRKRPLVNQSSAPGSTTRQSDSNPPIAPNARPPPAKAIKVTYSSGWSHEAGGCSVPDLIPTGASTTGRRARFRIPSSQ